MGTNTPCGVMTFLVTDSCSLSVWRFILWRWHAQMDRGLRSIVAMESSSPFITLWYSFSRQMYREIFSQRMLYYHHFLVREPFVQLILNSHTDKKIIHRYWKCADEITSEIHQQILSGINSLFCMVWFIIIIININRFFSQEWIVPFRAQFLSQTSLLHHRKTNSCRGRVICQTIVAVAKVTIPFFWSIAGSQSHGQSLGLIRQTIFKCPSIQQVSNIIAPNPKYIFFVYTASAICMPCLQCSCCHSGRRVCPCGRLCD